jgi:hypothetical protein
MIPTRSPNKGGIAKKLNNLTGVVKRCIKDVKDLAIRKEPASTECLPLILARIVSGRVLVLVFPPAKVNGLVCPTILPEFSFSAKSQSRQV